MARRKQNTTGASPMSFHLPPGSSPLDLQGRQNTHTLITDITPVGNRANIYHGCYCRSKWTSLK